MRVPCYITTEKTRAFPLEITAVKLDQLEAYKTNAVAFWLVDMQDIRAGWNTVCRIRRDLSPQTYLRPIVYWLGSKEITPEILGAANAHIDTRHLAPDLIDEWTRRFESVNQWIDRLPDASVAADTNMAFKVLRLIASEKREVQPITTTRYKSGYVYPILEPLFMKRDAGVLETLHFLEAQKLLAGRFVSRAHFCSHCDSAFLNFKETCPDCGKDDLLIDELVHHFKCAHTGSVSDFKRDDALFCPKCENRLHHIGVDYDKPSLVYHCNECDHDFQDPKVSSTCYHCGWTTEPENQVSRTIQSYDITAIGQNAAAYGLETIFSTILETDFKLFSVKEFKNFYDVEVARIKRYQRGKSALIMIRLTDIDGLYIRLGKRAKEIFSELSAIFKSVFRQSDVITARNESVFFVIVTETNVKQAEICVARLKKGITSLMENNLDFHPEIMTLIKGIDAELNIDATLETFLITTAIKLKDS